MVTGPHHIQPTIGFFVFIGQLEGVIGAQAGSRFIIQTGLDGDKCVSLYNSAADPHTPEYSSRKLPNEIQSTPVSEIADELKIAIVVSSFNQEVTDNLKDGAVRTLSDAGVADEMIDVVRVPGAWEIPLVAQVLAEKDEYSAIVCLGCVIRGQTTHDQHINRFVSLSLGELGLEFEIPVTFGILTVESRQQAIDRSGGAVANRGCEAAEAALQMCGLLDAIDASEQE